MTGDTYGVQDELEFKRKQKEEQQKLKELQAKASQRGPLCKSCPVLHWFMYLNSFMSNCYCIDLMYLMPNAYSLMYIVGGGIKKSGKK